ncbi:hypothetical protein Q7P37_004835 [Cladosporium fusiforme]
MPHYKPFALDQWIHRYGPSCKTGLHGSAVEPLSLSDLQHFSPSTPILDPDVALTYGPTHGLPAFRREIAALYQDENGKPTIEDEDVLVTAGAIDANHLILESVLKVGDHVIIQYPIYGPLLEIPRSVGAEVSFWKWREGQTFASWKLDMEELRGMIKPNTKLIMLNNPTNPTGFVLGRERLQQVIELAKPQGIMIMCDEVFRFLHHDEKVPVPPSLLELGYENSLVTSSLSKAFALPGLRTGWIAVSPSLRGMLMQDILRTRDYTTVTVSQIDQQIAAFVLRAEVRKLILDRSKAICRRNMAVIRAWAERNPWAQFIDPQGAGTCTLRVRGANGEVVDDVAFARALAEEESVCVPPVGLCFGQQADGSGETAFKGCLRVGIVTNPGVVEDGLDAIARLQARWD